MHEVRKLNARLNKNLDNYYGRGHNMPTEQNPEIYRTIKALTEIGERYCQRVNERFAVLPDSLDDVPDHCTTLHLMQNGHSADQPVTSGLVFLPRCRCC